MDYVDGLSKAIIWLLVAIITNALLVAIISIVIGTAFAGVAILITGFKFLISAVML